jgi:hypothetical protein
LCFMLNASSAAAKQNAIIHTVNTVLVLECSGLSHEASWNVTDRPCASVSWAAVWVCDALTQVEHHCSSARVIPVSHCKSQI